MGIFGLTIPEEYGGLGESLLTYALCVEEIARGWMSVSGIVNTHFIVAYMLMQHGTEEQKDALPAADGDGRGPRRVLDERAGVRVRRRGDHLAGRSATGDGDWVLDGQKMWLTNGGTSTLVAVLVRTDGRDAGRARRSTGGCRRSWWRSRPGSARCCPA